MTNAVTPEAVLPRPCSVARTLDLIGEKWTVLVLREVFLRVRRFDDIQRNTGAPRDILSNRLRKLVAAGILDRHQYQDRPARYEYRLTAKGRDLHPVLLTLMGWGDRYLSDGNPPLTLAHNCGAQFEPEVTCRVCGEPAAYRDLRITASLRD